MPDVRLVKPAVGVPQNIVCEPQSRFIFDFPMDAATLSRVDDHLVLTFDDGSTIRLENFYTAYSGENMPSFSVDGAEISGQDFFTAMNEPDLMPAAGPTAQVADGARFREYENMALLDGLDRLGGLDIGFDNGAVLPDLEEGGVSGLGGVTTEYYDAVDIDHPVIVTPGNPGELGDIPVIDNPDNPHDGNAGAAAGRDVLRVDESGLSEGMDVTASGYMMIEALDGVASIVIGGIEVFGGAGLTGATVPTDEGYLEVTGFDPATGRLDYTYHLTESTQEHTGEGKDSIAHDFIVTVTDTDGSVGTGVVSVVITDDVPTLNVTDGIDTVVSGATSDTVEGQIKFDFGADDGDGKTFTITAANGESKSYPLTGESVTVAGQYGTLTVNADGSYSYTANPNTQGTDSFTFTITDADGDSQSQSIDVTVTPAQGPTITDGISVNEKGLDDASDDSETDVWTAPEGYTVIGIVAQGSLGTATVTDDGKLEYTLNDAIKHEGTGTDTKTGADTVKVTVQDADGNTFEVDVKVDVVDDVPTLNVTDGIDTVVSGATSDTVEGQIKFDFGADDGDGKTFTITAANGESKSYPLTGESVTVAGQYGTLTVNADGSYSYTANPNTQGTDSFTFTITDADGDSQSQSIDVTVTPAQGPEGNVSLEVNEHGLIKVPEDSKLYGDPAFTNGEGQLTDTYDPEGFTVTGIKMADGSIVTELATEDYGKFTVENGSLKYQLTDNTLDHTGKGTLGGGIDNIGEPITIVVTDANGNTFEQRVDLTIKDDVPDIYVKDSGDGAGSAAPGGVMGKGDGGGLSGVSGWIEKNFGADGRPSEDGLTISVKDGTFTVRWEHDGIMTDMGSHSSYELPTKGTLYIETELGTRKLLCSTDGSRYIDYDYQAKSNPGAAATKDEFQIRIEDADGDYKETDLTINIAASQEPVLDDTNSSLSANEASMGEGIAWAAPEGFKVVGVVGSDGGAVYGSAQVVDGKLVYTLDTAYGHEAVQGANVAAGADTVKVTLENAQGNKFDVDVKVNITDDVASLQAEGSGTVINGAAGDPILTSTGDIDVDSGADGFGSGFTAQGDHVAFDLGGTNGMPESIQVILDGADTTSEVTLSVGADGALKGTLADGEELFSVTLTESSDGSYGYTMSQNHLFQMADGEGKPTGEGLELKFTTQDADGDTASASVTVPLTVEHVDTNAEGSVISNADDAITVSGGGDTAASIVAGDTGGAEGSESTPTNICFVLDISTSMNEKVTAGSNETRLQVAKDSITSFIEEHIIQKLQNGEGLEDINLSLVQFGNGATLKLDVTIADNGNTLMVGDTPYTDVNDFHNAIHAVIDGITAPQGTATNYQYGFQEAAKWFESHAEAGDRNITYFLSDGAPTVSDNPWTGLPAGYDKTGDTTQITDVLQAATAYDRLLESVGGGMEVHAIGFEGMGYEEMKTLAMFDNTSGGIPGTETVNANGMLYWGSVAGRYDNAIMGTDDVMAQRVNAADMDKSQTYFLFTGDTYQDPNTNRQTPFIEVKWMEKEDIPQEWISKWGDKFVSGWYSVNVEVQGDLGEAPTNYDLGLYPGRIYQIVPSEDAALGSSTIINSGSSLSDAFNSAYRPAQLANTGADTITADDAVNSALIYGAVMNTDMLLGELADKLGDKAPGLQPGSGNAVFAWLENPANAEALKGSAFEGWNHESTVKYIAEHGKELGYETRIDPKSSTFYLVDEEGNVLTLDGKPAEGVKLDDLTGREGGNDVITGSDGDDTIYGQEGNDSIHAGAGDDTIYGGTGDDVIYGEAGNDTIYGGAGDDTIDGGAGDDYISGGVGKDTIFAGDGNDIIVYDSEDVTISGGQGIDILVSNDALSMSDVEADSRIEGIEAVITGAGADNLKPADLAGLGIRIDGDTLTIDTTRWTQENSVWKQNDGGLSLELGSMWGAGQDANGNMSYTLTASGSAVMAFAAAHIPDIPVTVEDAASGQEASLVSSLIMPNVDSGTDAASGHPADAQQGDSLLGLDSAGMFGDDAADWPLFPADDAWETDSFLYGSIDGTQGDADMFKTYVDGLNTTDGMTIPAADNGMETSDFPLLGDGSKPNGGLGSADGSDADSPYTADSLTSENVMLFSAEGDDNLFFGGEEYNDVFAGSSDEILVYDANDYLIDGGSGIDFLVGGEDTPSLDDLLNHTA